jgi:hypothetical protein
MAQAERITTAVRELMSPGELPKSTIPRAAHTELLAAIAGNPPPPIRSKAQDLERRADHLQRVFAALHVYAAASSPKLGRKFPVAKSIAITSTAYSNSFRRMRRG